MSDEYPGRYYGVAILVLFWIAFTGAFLVRLLGILPVVLGIIVWAICTGYLIMTDARFIAD